MMYGLINGCGPNAYVAFSVTAITRVFSDSGVHPPPGLQNEPRSLLPNWCHAPSTRKPSGTSGRPRSTNAPACHPDDAISDSLPNGNVPPPTMPNRAGLEANCADAGTAKASDVTAAITLHTMRLMQRSPVRCLRLGDRPLVAMMQFQPSLAAAPGARRAPG